MGDPKIGHGNPPEQFRFKPGVSGNPKGRPRRNPAGVAEVIKKTLNAPIQFHEQGRTRTATRSEVGLKKLIQNAVKGDLAAAATLLQYREHAGQYGDVGIETVEIINWWEDYAGQTAEQKTREAVAGTQSTEPEQPQDP